MVQSSTASLDDELHIAGNVTILDHFVIVTAMVLFVGPTVMWAGGAPPEVTLTKGSLLSDVWRVCFALVPPRVLMKQNNFLSEWRCVATWPLSGSSIVWWRSSMGHHRTHSAAMNAAPRFGGECACTSCGLSLGEPGIERSSRAAT